MNVMSRRILRSLLAASVVLGAGASVFAAQLLPTYHLFDLKPGEKATGEFTLVNNEDANLRVFPETKNWFVLPENKDIPAAQWLRVKDAYFILKKGKSRTVRFTVEAPATSTGELVGMVSFSTESPERTMLNFKISAAVYVGIEGTERPAGDVVAFTVQNSTSGFQAGVIFENKGNVHLRPRGSVEVLNKGGDTVLANVSIELGGVSYPGSRKPYFGQVPGFTLQAGDYVARIHLFDVDRKAYSTDLTKEFSISKKGDVELR